MGSSTKLARKKKTTTLPRVAPAIQTAGQESSGVVSSHSRSFVNDEEVGGSASSTSSSARIARRSPIRGPVVESSMPTYRGVWRTTVLWSVGMLHVIDFGLGVSCVVYGALVHVVIAVMVVAISYGVLLVLGSFAGAIGYFSGTCNRMCLLASAMFGFLTFIVDIGAFVAILISWDSLIVFLNTKHELLMLSEGSVETIQSQKVLVAVIFAVLAFLELVRYESFSCLTIPRVN